MYIAVSVSSEVSKASTIKNKTKAMASRPMSRSRPKQNE